jgi:hypothetical protein
VRRRRSCRHGVAQHRARERRRVIDDGGEIEKAGAERLRHLGVQR